MKRWISSLVLLGWMGVSSIAQAGPQEDFFRAVRGDNAAKIRQLIEEGLDPNVRDEHGQTGLLIAIREPYPRVMEALIASPKTNVEMRNDKDESPLMLAALKGSKDIVERLIERDADINKPGWAPLHYAATHGHLDIMRLLLEKSAFIDAESPNGTTPLMMAAGYGTEEAVKLLLDEGADPMMKNQLGLSAIDFALRSQRPNIAEMIASVIRAKNGGQGGAW